MPMLMVQTNVEVAAEERGGLLAGLSARVAELLGKPESYVMVALEAGTPMLFGGSDGPTAYLELKSLGLPEERAQEFSAALCGEIERLLGIPPGRVYIEMSGHPRHLWGFNGATF